MLKRLFKRLSPVKVNSYWGALPAPFDDVAFETTSPATALQSEGSVVLSTGREIFRDAVLLQDAEYAARRRMGI